MIYMSSSKSAAVKDINIADILSQKYQYRSYRYQQRRYQPSSKPNGWQWQLMAAVLGTSSSASQVDKQCQSIVEHLLSNTC